MISQIISYLEKNRIRYDNTLQKHQISVIYNLFTNDFLDLELIEDPIITNYYGIYHWINKNYEEMMKYFNMSIKKRNPHAMTNLGNYYFQISAYENMIYYYEWAIKYEDSHAMYCYGYYFETQKEFKWKKNSMKYYYKMAAVRNHDLAIFRLGLYYEVKNKLDLMKKYYFMAIKLNNNEALEKLEYYINKDKKDSEAMFILGNHFETIKKYDQMKKYYFMAIQLNNKKAMIRLKNYLINENDDDAIFELGNYFEMIKDYDSMVKYYFMAIELNNENAFIRLKNYVDQTNKESESETMYKLGYIFQNLKNYNEMMKYYKRAIYYGNYNALIALAMIYYMQQDDEYILELFQMAIILDSNMINILFPMKHKDERENIKVNIKKYYLQAMDFLYKKKLDELILINMDIKNEFEPIKEEIEKTLNQKFIVYTYLLQSVNYKFKTIVEGLDKIQIENKDKFFESIIKCLKKKFHCAVSIKKHSFIIQLNGDFRNEIKDFLIDNKLLKKDQIKFV